MAQKTGKQSQIVCVGADVDDAEHRSCRTKLATTAVVAAEALAGIILLLAHVAVWSRAIDRMIADAEGLS
ncbi:hypothetical protein Tdes44962_MAKER06086 [Teratosphaeria destructans]|uniref:Uncharacterized protein n=1 Tax=Teratosphaeria destructans TaxID=418781 RepID=A0A9W7SI50_9PEZI|nr:hypothetical protein Tdes44962_MAKER06086 [Teratosphaeria destructans]